MSNVKDFGAKGDGLQDDTQAIVHAVQDGDGVLYFPRGDYRITKTIELDTTKYSRMALNGSRSTAKLIMQGAGPAIRMIGNHDRTADPDHMKPDIWKSQRMPFIDSIDIEGLHEEADGIELNGTVQAIVKNCGLRSLRHGIYVTGRNRNLIVEGCHIYHNTGAGILMEKLNLHQVNIVGNHISYNRLGGIRIQESEIRNLQITGNDIEYNTDRTHGQGAEPTAEIYIDTTAPKATVNEVTIASNTIQARPSQGGSNIRIIDGKVQQDRPPGLFAITGNVIGSQTNNVYLTGCYGFTMTGNTIYSASERNLVLEDCKQIVVGSNIFRRHTPDMGTGVLIENCESCIFSDCQIYDEEEGGQKSGIALLEIKASRQITVNSCQIRCSGGKSFILENCSHSLISNCIVENQISTGNQDQYRLFWNGDGKQNVLSNCIFDGPIRIDQSSNVIQNGNIEK